LAISQPVGGVLTTKLWRPSPLIVQSNCVSDLSPATRLFSKSRNPGDVEASKLVTSWSLGAGVDYQQVGGTWTEGDDIVSLSLSGDLNVLDKRVAAKPSRIIRVGQYP